MADILVLIGFGVLALCCSWCAGRYEDSKQRRLRNEMRDAARRWELGR